MLLTASKHSQLLKVHENLVDRYGPAKPFKNTVCLTGFYIILVNLQYFFDPVAPTHLETI